MMFTLLLHAYAVGVCPRREVDAARERNLAFRAIVGDEQPDFRTVSDSREIHTAALKPFFLDVLCIAGELGMVKLGISPPTARKCEPTPRGTRPGATPA
jgi:hypothetical protein